MRDYFYGEMSEQFNFIRVPKALFTDDLPENVLGGQGTVFFPDGQNVPVRKVRLEG